MPYKTFTRVLDNRNRFELPLEVLQMAGWEEGIELELWVSDENDDVILRRHKPCCVFCGGKEELRIYDGKVICTLCQEEITLMFIKEDVARRREEGL